MSGERMGGGGSFATGYDLITRKVWICPKHGEVGAGEVVPAVGRDDADRIVYFDLHMACGLRVERGRRGA